MPAVLALASCATPKTADPIVIAIAGIETRSPERSGPLTQVAEDRLHDGLVTSGRFKVVERRYMNRVLQEQREAGKLAGADWVLYGTIEAAVRGDFGGERNRIVGEVLLHIRVVRVEDGAFILSRTERATAEGHSAAEKEILLNRATRDAVEKFVFHLVALRP